jgi:CHAT domain-containing protein/Tfp pilus assembly protein PilF
LKAEVLMRQGKYEDSLSLLDEEPPSSFAQSQTAVWRDLTRGSSLTYLERFPLAAQAFERAQVTINSRQPDLMGELLLRQGTLASMQWHMDDAVTTYRSSLKFAREHNDSFLEASALGSLGVAAARMEHHDESIDWNKKALELDKSHGWLGLTAKAEGNIGWSYYELGDFENALALYEQAEKDSIQAGLGHERELWLTNSGTARFALRDFDGAEKDSREALTLAKELQIPGDIVECNQNLAVVSMQKGRLESAVSELSEALEHAKVAPDPKREIYTRLLQAHIAARQKKWNEAQIAYSEISANPESPTSIRWEAQASLAVVHASQGNPKLAEHEFNSSIETISNARDALQREDFRLSFLSSAIRFYDEYINFLVDQHRPMDALKIADRSRAQTLEGGLRNTNKRKPRTMESWSPQEIAARQKSTVLFYWLGDEKSYLWAVSEKGPTFSELGGRGPIEEMLKRYRGSFLEPRDPIEAGNIDGAKLFQVLVGPAKKLIPANSRVIVIPDGSLNSLNFETLIVSEPKPHYWIDDVTVTSANSLALLERAAVAPPPKDGRLLLVGDALLANPEFPPLPQASKEVGLVESHFDPKTRMELLKGNATSAKYFSSAPERFDYLHFTTHGTASRMQPLESAVILSPEGDSYKLYARDILRHPLNAYLVTISACNGAGLKTYAGEGLVGLSWAFLRAGAHNVIGGLWEVSNASTPPLMDELYKAIHNGDDPATALRKAKLTLVRSSGNYRKPFYWAPFVLYAGS